jgi:hypothetical protein
MTIMHHLLAGALRVAGRFRDAAEVESAAQPEPARGPIPVEYIPPSEPLPSTPAIVSHDAEHGAHGSTSHESGDASSPAPEAGGGSGSNDSTVAQAGAAGGGDSLGSGQIDSGQGAHAEGDDQEHGEDHGHQQETHSQHTPPTPESHALHDDPLAGIYSERFRVRLEREAFVGASSTAQDSAIVQTADRLLPAEVRDLLQHDVPNIDISTAARSTRIEGLGGEMPAWAQLELFKDPAHARLVEAAASRENHTQSHIRQSEPTTEVSRASTERASSRAHEMER